MTEVAKLRKLAGMSQQELSEKTGTSRARLVYIEGGYQGPPEETERILAVLKRAIQDRGERIRQALTGASK